MEKIIAHRGASKEAPENTLASIELALSLEVDYIEIDVHLSKDGIPIVIHDPSAARMLGIKKSPEVSHLTLKEIQQLDVGSSFQKAFIGEKIPSLQEVLNLEWNKTGLMLEIKKSSYPTNILVKKIFDVVFKANKPLTSILIGSFSLEIVKEVKRHLSKTDLPIEIIGIVEKHSMIEPFIKENVKRLAIWHQLISKKAGLLSFLKKQEIDVWSFTVDDLTLAKFLISLGVNGIISNDPRMMMESKIFYLQ